MRKMLIPFLLSMILLAGVGFCTASPPSYQIDSQSNVSSIYGNSTHINFNSQWSNSSVAGMPNNYIFSWNYTGTWVNSSWTALINSSATGPWIANVTKISNASWESLGANHVIGYRFYANESAGGINVSQIATVTVFYDAPKNHSNSESTAFSGSGTFSIGAQDNFTVATVYLETDAGDSGQVSRNISMTEGSNTSVLTYGTNNTYAYTLPLGGKGKFNYRYYIIDEAGNQIKTDSITATNIINQGSGGSTGGVRGSVYVSQDGKNVAPTELPRVAPSQGTALTPTGAIAPIMPSAGIAGIPTMSSILNFIYNIPRAFLALFGIRI